MSFGDCQNDLYLAALGGSLPAHPFTHAELEANALTALPPELRLVFLLREAEGLAVAAIARDLALNPITVRTRLFRARRLLRSALEARLQGGFAAVFPFDGARCAHMADRVVAALRAAGRL